MLFQVARPEQTTLLFQHAKDAEDFANANNAKCEPWNGEAYVDIYLPVAGWKCVMYSRDDDVGGMFTPWQTGFCGWETPKEAYAEAHIMAEGYGIPVMYQSESELATRDARERQEQQESIARMKALKEQWGLK